MERGRRWKPEEYPRDRADAWLWNPSRPQEGNRWFEFRVFKYMVVVQGVGGGSLVYAQNLYVADGSIIPEAIGLNPSKTIAALAERIADLM